jgi:CspA family cold shock protein
MRGKVVNFLSRKGFGFILGEDGEQVFVHFSDISGSGYKSLVEGEEVEYSVENSPKGKKAIDVVRLNPPEPEPDVDDDMGAKTW